jgi:serine/threonine-protein kinase
MEMQESLAQTPSPEPAIAGGKYALIAELGRGGMATAYLSVSRGPLGFNKLVVVKRLRPALAAESEFLRMFLDEARLAARIDHPNVVQTFEVGAAGQDCFIAMEFVDGQSLEHLWGRAKRLAAKGTDVDLVDAAPGIPLNLSLHVVEHVLDALHCAHNLKNFDGTPLNVVHRDVSPHNVMITYEGHVKLLDFGIAKAADSRADTRTGVIKGKWGYMAPEQFGGGDVDRRADVFAVGVMLWQALTGKKMWRDLSDVEVFQRLATGNIHLPSAEVDDVDPALEAICMKALAPSVADRFATAAEFRSELDEYLSTHPELRATPRELGEYVGNLFQADRAKIHALIEEQVAKKTDQDVDDVMNLSKYFGNSGAPRTRADVSSATSVRRKRRWPVLVGIAVSALCLAGAAATFATRNKQPAQVSAPAAKSELLVRVSPPEAKVSLDGVALAGSPPSGTFGLDHATHRIYAKAPGYVARSENVLLDSDRVAVDLALEPLPVPAAVPTTPAMASAGPALAGRMHGVAGRSRHSDAPSGASSSTPTSALSPPPPAATSAAAPSPAAPAPTGGWPTGPNLDKTDPWAASTKQ